MVEHVAGELSELEGKGKSNKVDKQEWWDMLNWYQQHEGWSRGRAAHTYREQFGVWPRGLEENRIKPPSPELQKFIGKRLRAYFKKKSLGLSR